MSTIYDKKVTWSTGEAHEETTRPVWQVRAGAATAALLLLALTFWLGYRTGQAPLQAQVAQLKSAIGDQKAQIADLQGSQTTCSEDGAQIQQAGGLLGQGKAALAAQIASTALHNKAQPPCQGAHLALATLVYRATLDDLFSTSANPADLGYSAMLTWQGAERQADHDHVPPSNREEAITVAQQAFNAHQWLLARAAFLRAWQAGTVTASDLQSIRFYYSTLRNLGRAQLHSARGQALVTLATADAISSSYTLGQGEAHQDLISQLGPDTRHWPEPSRQDPVLAAGRRG